MPRIGSSRLRSRRGGGGKGRGSSSAPPRAPRPPPTGHLDGGRLAEILAGGTPADAADRLVEFALEAGGEDNVTVVVVDPLVAPVPAHRAQVPAAAGGVTSDEPRQGRRRRALVATFG